MKKQESVFIIPNTYWHMHNNTGNENVDVVFVCWVIIRCYVCVIVLVPGIYIHTKHVILSELSLTSGHRFTGPCLMACCMYIQ